MHWLLLMVAGCSWGDAPTPVPEPVVAEPIPVLPEPEEPLVAPTSGRFAGSHILIAHNDAVGATTDRTADQARELAERVHAQALAGDDFAQLAATHSDDPSGARGGTVGVFAAGTMMPAFEAALASVEPGAVAPMAETPYGIHIIRRDAVVEGRFRHIVVGYAGAVGSSASRTEAEAQTLIESAAARLAAGQSWESLCAEISEDELASLSGDLGIVAPGQMVPAFDDAAFALAVGSRSGPVHTPYGVHLIERY